MNSEIILVVKLFLNRKVQIYSLPMHFRMFGIGYQLELINCAATSVLIRELHHGILNHLQSCMCLPSLQQINSIIVCTLCAQNDLFLIKHVLLRLN